MMANKIDNDFLHRWQKLLFVVKDEKKSVMERVDANRHILNEIYVNSVTMRLPDDCVKPFFQEYTERYSTCLDSSNPLHGLNSYADQVHTMSSGLKNECNDWKCSLTLESMNDLECIKHLKQQCEIKLSSQVSEIQRPCSAEINKKPKLSPSTVNHHNLNVLSSKTKKPATNPWARFYEENHVDSKENTCNGPRSSKPCITSSVSVFKTVSTNKKGRGPQPTEIKDENVTNDISPNSSSFRTAREQLNIDNQKKNNKANGPNSYGQSKKSLGTRRGISSKFVPPLARDDEEFSRSVISSNNQEDKDAIPSELQDERLKHIEPKMIELITSEIMDQGPPITWEDIAGLEFAKKTIQEIVVWPMLRPDIFTGLRGPPKGLLLFGPPGTGKTLIGKCIASQSKSTFFSISASSLTSKWVGEGEKMVRALFAVARCQQPAVVFIDEIDSLLTQRTDGENEASRRIKTEFLVQLDGATTGSDERLLVVGATNRPQEIDEAARRRFVKRLYIPLPEQSARQQIILNLLSNQTYDLSNHELEDIASRSQGYSGADMANLCREAALGPIRCLAVGDIEHISVDQVRPILYKDFNDAFNQVRASVSSKDLDLYIEWNELYGASGSRK